jgi:hypothetical protein
MLHPGDFDFLNQLHIRESHPSDGSGCDPVQVKKLLCLQNCNSAVTASTQDMSQTDLCALHLALPRFVPELPDNFYYLAEMRRTYGFPFT